MHIAGYIFVLFGVKLKGAVKKRAEFIIAEDAEVNAYIDDFAAYLGARASKSTVASYRRDVELLYKRLAVSDSSVVRLGTEQLQEYLARLSEKGRSNATVLRAASSLRSFYAYLEERGLMRENPAERLSLPKKDAREPVILTTDEVDLLLSLPKGDAKGIRDRAMLELLYATGVKVSELISLELRDIDLDRGVLICRGAARERVVPVGHAAEAALAEYLSSARSAMTEDERETALFVNCRGRSMTRQGFWKLVKGYIAEAGINKDVTPQTLRHSFAVHLLRNGADLDDVSEMLGFNDRGSGSVYRSMVSDRLKKTYEKTHPRA